MKFFLVVLASVALFVACKKKEKCEAGTGGNVTLVLKPQHHGDPVRPYNAYLKFNTQEFPGSDPSDYDLSLAADTMEDHVHAEGLKCGNYYIYMKGYDTASAEMVNGGIPYTLSEDATGEITVNIPVTE